MRWEVDYTDDIMEMEECSRRQDSSKSNGISEEKLERFWEYCEQVQKQFERRPSPEKREKLMAFYQLMKKVAYIHSGRLTLDIDEETLEARMEYYGSSLSFMDEETEETKNIVAELIGQYSTVFIEPYRKGIRLTVEDQLYDIHAKSKDHQLLDRIRKELREME